jgi:hypothetical protein
MRLLEFDASLFPRNNTATIFDPSATKVFQDIATWEPAFDAQNRMVVGYNPFWTSNPRAGWFVGVYNAPLGTQTNADGFLNDYYSQAFAATFDSSDNLYVGDLDRGRVLVYKHPLKRTLGSLALNGTTAYAEAAQAPDLNVTGDWSLEAWFKDEDPNGFDHDFRQILMKGDRNANPEAPYYLLVGRRSVLAGVRTGGQDYPIVSDLTFQGLDPRAWHHVAVTFRADLNVLNLWLDARHIGYLFVPAHSTAGNSLPLEIGRNGPITGKYWLGKLEDVRIWNVARKGIDITRDFQTQLTGPQPGLVANWHFDEGSGPMAFDSSGNRHDATLNGGASFSADARP